MKILDFLSTEEYNIFKAYGERSLFCWDSLHIALSDGNLEDSNIIFCISYAEEEGDTEGINLGKVLLRLTEEERQYLYENFGE